MNEDKLTAPERRRLEAVAQSINWSGFRMAGTMTDDVAIRFMLDNAVTILAFVEKGDLPYLPDNKNVLKLLRKP